MNTDFFINELRESRTKRNKVQMGMMRGARNPQKTQVCSCLLKGLCLCLVPFWREGWPGKMAPGSKWTLGDQQYRIWKTGSCGKREDWDRVMMDVLRVIFFMSSTLSHILSCGFLGNSSPFHKVSGEAVSYSVCPRSQWNEHKIQANQWLFHEIATWTLRIYIEVSCQYLFC